MEKYVKLMSLRGTFDFTLNNPFSIYVELTITQWHKEIDAFNNILLNTLN